MKILFVSGLIEKSKERDILEKTKKGIDVAANVQVRNFIYGIESNIGEPISLIMDMRIPLWPDYPQKIIKGFEWSHTDNAKDYFVGRINRIDTLARLSKAFSIYRKARKWIKSQKESIAVFVYEMHTPYLLPVVFAATSKTKICLIVPDLPEYMDEMLEYKTLKKILKKVDRVILNVLLKRVNYYVLFTDPMKDAFKAYNKPSTRVEALASFEDFAGYNVADKKEAVVLYTGTLDKRYGIIELMKAFSLVENKDALLWICGVGNAKDEVVMASEKDSRIRWLGHLSRDEVLKLQKEATLLVNPRAKEDEYVKYSFPSKTIEYMLSGTPVIMRRLEGIPNEYYKYVIVDEIGTVESLADVMRKALAMDKAEMDEMGHKARRFIIEEKNPHIQCGKILKMMNIID